MNLSISFLFPSIVFELKIFPHIGCLYHFESILLHCRCGEHDWIVISFFRLFPCALKAIYVFCLLIRFRHCLPNIGNWIYFVSAFSFADASIYRQAKLYRMLYGFRKQRNIEEPYCLFYFTSRIDFRELQRKPNRKITSYRSISNGCLSSETIE